MDPVIQKSLEDLGISVKELIAAQEKKIQDLEAKLARPAIQVDEKAAKVEAQKAAFSAFVRKGNADGLEEKAMNIGTGTAGGYAVPSPIDAVISQVETNGSPMRQVCTVIPVTNENWSKLVGQGDAVSGWVGETGARSETAAPTLQQIKPQFGEAYANVYVTGRALDDVMFDAEGYVAQEIGKSFALLENTKYSTGAGTAGTSPKGLLAYTIAASPSWGQLKQVKSGTSATLSADKIIEMAYSLKPGYRAGSVWMMSALTWAAVRQLKDSANQYLVGPGLNGPVDSLLGFKVVENEDMPAIGAASNSIVFGNFARGYLIADVRNTTLLRDPYSAKPHVSFYATKRVGGCLLDSNAFVVNTLSA